MGALPKSMTALVGGFRLRVVHGGVASINRFVFGSERAVITDELERADADCVIAGHAGIPFVAKVGHRAWFNAGVIGMPANDGTADTWYGLVGVEGGSLLLSTRRLGYDHHSAAAAMRRCGHADGYARTLATGLWPSLDILPPPERAATGRRIPQQTTRLP